MLFDYSISNPPYQMDASNEFNNSANNIFHLFYAFGVDISEKTIMIFPGGRWMQRSLRGSKASETIFPTVNTIDWYSNKDNDIIFDNVSLSDGISIVSGSYKKNDMIVLNGDKFNRPKDNNIIPLSKQGSTIARKILNNFDNFIIDRKETDRFFGPRTYFVERNPDMVELYSDNKLNKNNTIVSYMANSSPGISKRVEKYWLNPKAIEWNEKRKTMFHHWKVVAAAAGIGKNPGKVKTKILENNSVVGETWTIIGSFENYEEANNFNKYINTAVVRFLLNESKGGKARTWGYFVPDLDDYTGNNPDINWSAPLDLQLYELFELTDDEIDVIQNTVLC